MKRKMMSELIRWKEGPNKHGLVVTGSRRIGKTHIIDEFAKANYAQYLRIDFRLKPCLKDIFHGDIDAVSIYYKLKLDFPDFNPGDGDSILFLDEIQLCPEAMSAIKPLVADGRCDIIASCSLAAEGSRPNDRSQGEWDVVNSILANNEHVSPMGYRSVKRMHALDFEEYLWALGITEDVTERIRERIRTKAPLEEAALDALNRYFTRYLAIGGMPDVVRDTLGEDVDWAEVDGECERIRMDYAYDVSRFAPGPIRVRVQACIDSMPDQLGKDNRKFMYTAAEKAVGNGVENPGLREYRNPILWIEGAGMASVCRNVSEPVLPLRSRHDGSLKMYCYDTGVLISAFQGSRPNDGLRLRVLRGDTEVNAGAIVENAVANMIEKCGFQLHYFERNRPISEDEPTKRDRIEVDFIVDLGGELSVIEVKSGKNRRAGSLKKLRTDPKYTIYPVKRFIKLENGNIRVDEDGVEHYPIFAAAFMDSMYDRPEPPPLPPPITQV